MMSFAVRVVDITWQKACVPMCLMRVFFYTCEIEKYKHGLVWIFMKFGVALYGGIQICANVLIVQI